MQTEPGPALGGRRVGVAPTSGFAWASGLGRRDPRRKPWGQERPVGKPDQPKLRAGHAIRAGEEPGRVQTLRAGPSDIKLVF